MDIINMLLAADVDPNPELNMHRPSRGGNSGRFGDNQLSTGCTPLFRATLANDLEVIRALLAKGASPNINAMGFTSFLLAAGVNPGGRGVIGGAPNTALIDLMIEHGADVNTQVTGTKTYSMRVARSPSSNEGMSALHAAVQASRTELVRYLLDKGVNAELADSDGRQAIDLIGGGAANAASAAEIRALLERAASKK
jgi:ankyrin repeat protein